jgi:hypothetical protein
LDDLKFISSSVAVNKRYEIQLNKKNKLSLKKKAIFNARLNVNLEGVKKNNSHSYNLNLTPEKNLPLVSFEGRFYKLTANSQYKEITDFKVPTYTKDKCTSESFRTSVGVDLCLKISRPEVGTLRNLLVSEEEPEMNLIANLDDDDDAEDGDDEDEEEEEEYASEESQQRPKFTLSGPYSYEVFISQRLK